MSLKNRDDGNEIKIAAQTLKLIAGDFMKTKNKTDSIYSISEEISHREIEGQILLLRPDDNFLYTVNGTGKLIWLEILKRKPVSTIAKNLAKEFNLSEEKAGKDVLKFVRELERKRIIFKKKIL